jgi:hypothetical protein
VVSRHFFTPAGASREEGHEDPGLQPPDADGTWIAEIIWRQAGDEGRFCVLAHDQRGGGTTVISRSEALDWPPTDADAVRALVDAADTLTEALVSAGWNPAEPGAAWYERRFEWAPAAPSDWTPPRPELTATPRRRFRPGAAWPERSEELWRCEIKWKSGYTRSRFEAVVHDPVRGTDKVIGRSPSFKWMLLGEPDAQEAQFREAARDLAAILEAVGWERVGTGYAWYAARFIWQKDEPPGDHLEDAALEIRAP